MANWPPLTEDEIKTQLAAADDRARISDATEPRAKSARYDRKSGRVMVELTNGCLFAFPAKFGQGLQNATVEQLAAIEVTPSGYGLHWEALDADLAIPSLVAGIFGSKRWMSALGQQLGRSQSEAKRAAARENGKRGGRPRKVASS